VWQQIEEALLTHASHQQETSKGDQNVSFHQTQETAVAALPLKCIEHGLQDVLAAGMHNRGEGVRRGTALEQFARERFVDWHSLLALQLFMEGKDGISSPALA
jgi:hypothetical protein